MDKPTLTEVKSKGPAAGGYRRRWFGSPDMDLIVWYRLGASPIGFDLYYDKGAAEHVFIWREDSGYRHLAVDDGEQKPALNYKQSPILIPDGKIDANRIFDLFTDSSDGLPAGLAAFVANRIKRHPKYAART